VHERARGECVSLSALACCITSFCRCTLEYDAALVVVDLVALNRGKSARHVVTVKHQDILWFLASNCNSVCVCYRDLCGPCLPPTAQFAADLSDASIRAFEKVLTGHFFVCDVFCLAM
jgi:hypothetical protein